LPLLYPTTKEESNIMKETRKTSFAALFLGATLFSSLASAQELEPGVALPQLQALRQNVVSATVVTLPKGSKFLTFVRAKELAKFGCTFEVTEYNDLMSVIDILDHADMRPSGKPAMPLDLRFSVVLKARDGKETRMYAPDLVMKDGTIDGVFAGIPVAINGVFSPEIRAWASRHVPTSLGTNKTCN
jgi:hypothetical protein